MVGNKNISADAGFKDPVTLRVKKGFLFGKYLLHQSVANLYLLLAILFLFDRQPTGCMQGNMIVLLL